VRHCYRRSPFCQPFRRNSWSFIDFCDTQRIAFHDVQRHCGGARRAAFKVGKPSPQARHAWGWAIEPRRHLPNRQRRAGGTPTRHSSEK
jgi:hypothetical protein